MIHMVLPPRRTLVKNQLMHPDGLPRAGERVEFYVRAVTDWRADREGRIVGTTSTWTGPNGLWRICLLPWTAYDARLNTIVEVREGGITTGYIQVPEVELGDECWMGNLLVDPPPPARWTPIARLADLHDVDRESVAAAPDGAVLIKRGGRWVAEVPTFGKQRLAELDDVDPTSMSTPEVGDHLRYLGTPGWGISRPPRTWLRWRMAPHPTDPQGGRKVQLTVLSRIEGTSVLWYWDDEAAGDPGTVIGPGTTTLEHVYADSNGSAYYPSMGYTPAIPGEGLASYDAGLVIPMSEPIEASNEPKHDT